MPDSTGAAVTEPFDPMTLRFKAPELEAIFDTTWIREQRCYDVVVWLCEVTLTTTFFTVGSLQRLACTAEPDAARLSALGPLASDFPCSASTWQKVSHMLHHGHMFDLLFRYKLGDYSVMAWSATTPLLVAAPLLLGSKWDKPLLRHTLACGNQLLMLSGNLATLLWSLNHDWLPATAAYLYSTQHNRFGPIYYLTKDLFLMRLPVKVFFWVGLVEWLLCLATFVLCDWHFDGVVALDHRLVQGSFLLLYMCPYMWLHYSERRMRRALLEQHGWEQRQQGEEEQRHQQQQQRQRQQQQQRQ